MRSRLGLLLGALAAALAGLPAAPAAAAAFAPAVPTGWALSQLAAAEQAIVALEPCDGGEPLVRAAGGTLVSAPLGLWTLPGREAARLVGPLHRRGALRYAEPAHRRVRLGHYADPLATAEVGYHLYAVNAHTVEPPGPGFPITIIDSGIDVANPDFAGRPNVVGLNAQVVPTTRAAEYHGTEIAAIAAAATNTVGAEGLYPQAVIRSYDLAGDLSDPAIIAGIGAAVAAGPSVINLSFGGPENTRALYEAVQFAFGRGSLIVASAGNELRAGNPTLYPAAYPHVLTVGSVGRTLEPSGFSSAHPTVDLAVPGEGLPVTLPGGAQRLVTGTSFAAPIVSAAAAWARTVRGPMHVTQLFDLVRSAATDIAEPGVDSRTGLGLLDVPKALTAPLLPVDPQEPNQDLAQVVPGGVFGAGKALVSQRFRARLHLREDPDDVYRVSLGPNQQLTVTVTADDDVRAALFAPDSRTVNGTRGRLAFSDRAGAAAERLVYANRTRRPVVLFLHVKATTRVTKPDAQYAVAITRARARR